MDRQRQKNSPANQLRSQDSEDAMPSIGPHNPALGEIYQRLYPEMRRPKPNQEAIAAALQAMQRLTMESDSEAAAEDAPVELYLQLLTKLATSVDITIVKATSSAACAAFPLEPAPSQSSEPTSPVTRRYRARLRRRMPQTPRATTEAADEVHPQPGAPAGTHHYHHHYHHHYFQGGASADSAPRSNASESAREADRMRVAAAAKGEPMSRGEAAVRRLTQEWVLACNTRQLDELMELYAPDALVLRSNLPPIRGAVAVREFFFASLEAGLGEVALDPMRVEVLGDLAHEVGRYSALVPGNGRQTPRRARQVSLGLRQAGERRLEAGLGVLVERPYAFRRGIRHSQACGSVCEAPAAEELVAQRP